MRALALALALLGGGCREALLHGLDEPEANDLTTLLAGAGVPAAKIGEGGGRFRVEVSPEHLAPAWKLARTAGHPRTDEAPAPSRLIVSPTETAARERAARAVALSRLLRGLPGVIQAQVVLGPDAHAAAVLRVEEDAAGPSVERVRALVAAGAGLADPGAVEVEVHALPRGTLEAAAAPRPGPGRVLLGAVAGAAVLLALLAVVLLRHVRRLRGQLEAWDPLESTCRHASLSIL